MKKVVIGVVLVLVLGLNRVVAEETFSDVSSTDWYYDNVRVLIDAGIVGGYGDGRFGPEDTMKVDQFIKTMVVALDEDPGNSDGYWAQAYIDKALELKILQANDFDDYRAMISREDMSKLSVRTLESLEGKKNYTYDAKDNDLLLNEINDRSSISDLEGEAYISQSYELGLITGYPDGSFKPKDGLKRSEACTVIRRVIEASQRKPYQAALSSNWDVRAEKVYEETGIRPFENTTTDLDEGVITQYELKNIQDTYSFASFLSYNTEDDQKDDWNVIVSAAAVKLFGDNNLETQLFELEYIFRNIHDVDETVTNEVITSIRKRITGVSTPTEKWELDNGAFIQIYGSGADSKTIAIDAVGFKF